MSNPSNIDLDAMMRNLDDQMNQKAFGEDSGIDGILSQSVTSPSAHDHGHDHDHEHVENLQLEAPFIVLQFQHTPTDQEGVFSIDAFKMNIGGINAEPEAILAHLRMAVASLEQQTELIPDNG